MKSLSAKTFQCGVTVQGLTTLSGTVYLTALTNTATWDYVVVGTTAQGQLYTRTYAQLMSDITSGIGLSGYVPTSRTLTINGVSYDLTANRSWTISTVDYTSRLQHQVKAGVAINKGQAVYVTSADGTNMIVGLASNASEATSSKTMGLLDATVSTNGFANVVTEGLLAGLNTSTATAGDPVWLGVNGNLIFGLANKPYAPANLVFIGIVTRVNVNNGEIFVKVQNGFELNELHDVDLITTAPINGHLLGYNGTLWVNKTIAGWLGYTPANASGTTNYLSKFTGSTTLGNSQIFDNGTNVGIGTTSPLSKLDVVGQGIFQGTLTAGFRGANVGALNINNNNSDNVLDFTQGLVFTNNNSNEGAWTHAGIVSVGSAGYNGNLVFGTDGDSTRNTTGITEKMRITSAGNVGIGVTGPAYRLHVKSDTDVVQVIEGTTDVTYTQYYNLSSGTGGSGNGLTIGLNGTSALVWYREAGDLLLGTNNTERVRILAGGNVGIGTSSPSSKLEVYTANSDTKLTVTTTGGNSYVPRISLDKRGDSAWNISSPAGGFNFAIDQDGSNKFWIASSTGNVGIGTINPPYKLTVVGDTYVNTANLHLNTGYGIVDAANISYKIGFPSLGNFAFENVNVGIGTTSPSTKLDVNGVITATGGNSTNWNTAYSWGNHSSAGYVPQARTLTINGTSYDLSANRSWTIATTTPGGSDTQFQYNSSGTLAGASALTYNSTTNRVGINQASPGYDLDVNGQVRVQDKLRVGNVNSGNGVVHMSSTATINPSATTIVWSQNVSVGMCAFIEYYILNNNTTTDQRAGTIIVTWNQSGTPTIAHTETTTPDIGSTTAINFTSSLVGSDARINAVSSSPHPYTMIMSYKYF